MQTTEIQAELNKLNAAQRGALRARFTGRPISYLRVEGDHITVSFGNGVTHSMWIGPRGGTRNYAQH